MNRKEEIAKILTQVADDLKPKDLEIVNEYLEVHEYGLALEHICIQLDEYDVNIPESLYSSIENTFKSMEMKESSWNYLKDLVISNEIK